MMMEEIDDQTRMAVRKIMYRAGQRQATSRVQEAVDELTAAINRGRTEAVAQAFSDAMEELSRENMNAATVVYLQKQVDKFRASV